MSVEHPNAATPEPTAPLVRFSIEAHQGPYSTWPLRSRLLDHGKPTDLWVPGFCLLRQYKTEFGFLLIADRDCPYEESTCISLIDESVQHVLAEREFAAPYNSYTFKDIEWLGPSRAKIEFWDRPTLVLTIRQRGIRWIRPRLAFKRAWL